MIFLIVGVYKIIDDYERNSLVKSSIRNPALETQNLRHSVGSEGRESTIPAIPAWHGEKDFLSGLRQMPVILPRPSN